MRIAYVPELEALAKSMQEYGHDIYPINQVHECDAVLCTQGLPKVQPGPQGALYIYAREKSPQEVQQVIRSRLYTDLFER